jgi:uncharacterized protein YcnI
LTPLLGALLWHGCALAHITLPPQPAKAGSDYRATFRVGHACADAQTTTGIEVRLPAGFTLLAVEPRTGWAMSQQDQTVSWRAVDAAHALPQHERTTFNLSGRLPEQPGTVWFKVRQICDRGEADWAQIPPAENGTKPAFPAARLDVISAD